MKVTNETHWRTDQLKAILHRVANDELNPEQRKRLRVTIVYAKRYHGCSSGLATIKGSWMKIRVQPEKLNLIDFAFVAAHEMAHTRGMDHNSMRGNPAYNRINPRTQEIYAWAESMPIERKPEKQKLSSLTITEKKIEKSHQMVKQWTTKAKRTQTILKKWQRRLKSQESRLAAMRSAQP